MARIVYIIKSLASKHGVERTLTDKANYLAEHGHQVTMVTYEQGDHTVAFPLHSSIEHVDLDCRFFTLSRYPLWKRWQMQRVLCRQFRERLQGFLQRFTPDLIITTTYSFNCMSEIMALKERTPVIVESHSVLVYELPADTWIHKIQKRVYLKSLKPCDLLIALTEGDAACWRHYVRQVEVVPNPVSFYVDHLDALSRQPGRIISVGRLQEPKRFDVLIDAFALIAQRFPDWSVDIYGDGEFRERLGRQIHQHGLASRVSLRMPTSDIRSAYEHSQLFVMSSDFEGFGLVLVEAMACGLPVISTDCPYGPAEIVEDGVTGLLCKMDAHDMADKLSWLITHEQERVEMGRRAHQAAARYRQTVVMQQWELVYLRLLKKGMS